MVSLLTVSSKNQITLPVSIARTLGLKKGSKMWTKIEGKKIILEKEDSWDDLQGILADTPAAKKYTVLEAIELAKKKEAQRIAMKNGI